jgi:hypothetical protein
VRGSGNSYNPFEIDIPGTTKSVEVSKISDRKCRISFEARPTPLEQDRTAQVLMSRVTRYIEDMHRDTLYEIDQNSYVEAQYITDQSQCQEQMPIDTLYSATDRWPDDEPLQDIQESSDDNINYMAVSTSGVTGSVDLNQGPAVNLSVSSWVMDKLSRESSRSVDSQRMNPERKQVFEEIGEFAYYQSVPGHQQRTHCRTEVARKTSDAVCEVFGDELS